MPYSSVDEQVVKMTFDNSNFDQNINNSIKTLNRLDKQLITLNKNDFSKLTSNVDNLAKTFTIKGQVMLGVLTKIGNKIVNLGSQAFRKLTQGIRDGLGEYNQIIESTQTIYQNVKQSGASIGDVYNALDELNDYADKTIYNFGQMTRMIGMFTSAGVGLDKSVSTIKGLANASALVGATPERAQIAWNAVSRAMSSGKFTNVIWRSLELSNIAGKQFNTVIKEVARVNKVTGKGGKNIDQMIKKYGSLRESLREGWLTKDIFNEAMQIMSGALDDAELKRRGYTKKQIKELRAIAEAAEEAATKVKTFKQLMDTTAEAIGSGWAQSFRILIGDLEDAKKLYTRISEVISGFIDNNARIRNRLFKQIVDETTYDSKWKTGRDNFRQIIENMLAVVKTFLKAVKTGFLNVFPVERISAAARKVLEVVEKFTRAFVLNSGKVNKAGQKLWNTEDIDEITDSIDNLIRFFRGLASAVDIAWMAISQPIKVIIDRIPFFNNFVKNTNEGIIGIVAKLGKFGDKITVFKDAIKNTEFFGTVLEAVLDHIDELGEEYPVIGALLSVFRGLKNIVSGLRDTFESMQIKPFSVLLGTIKLIITVIWKILNGIFSVLKAAKNSIDWSWLDGPKQILIGFLKTLSDYGQGLISFEKVTGKIGKAIETIFSKIAGLFGKKDSNNLKTATGETTKSLSNLNTTVSKIGKKITTVWNKITGFFKPIGDFFANIKTNSDWTLDGIAKKIALIGSGVAAATLGITHLTKSLYKIRILDNINELFVAGIDVIKAYQREMSSKMILNIAISIGILAAAMVALAYVPYDKLENGLVIFSSFMMIMSSTLVPILKALAKFNESLGKTKRQLDKFDVLNNLTKQIGKFANKIASGINAKLIGQTFKDIAISIFILVGAIAALVLLFKLDGDNTIKAMKALAQFFGVIAAALLVLIIAVRAFNKLGKDTASTVKTFSAFFTLAGVATVILSIAASALILVGALAKLAKIDTTALGKNFDYLKSLIVTLGHIAAGLAVIVGVFSIFSKGNAKSLLIVAPILLALAAAATVMVLAITKLASIDTKKLRACFDGLNKLLKTIGLITAAITGIIGLSTLLEGLSSKPAFGIVASIAAITAMIYVLSKVEKIDDSVLITLGILTAALAIVVSLLALITLVISRAKTTFSTQFADVISKISIGIAAIIASIGVMTAGVAALIASLSNTDITDADANRAGNDLVTKLKIIAAAIESSLPEMQEIFYNLGKYAGTMFTSFTFGFLNNLADTADTYNSIADKLVNTILDLLGKVVDILSNRKDDIKRIIQNIVDLIAGVITEILNDLFKKNDSNKFKEEDILKILGFGAFTIGGGALLLNIASKFNTIALSVKNLKGVFSGLGTALGKTFKPFGIKIKAGIKLLKIGKITVWDLSKVFIDCAATVLAFAAALAEIYIGITALTKGLKQLSGEAKYVRSDVTDIWSAFDAFFNDAEFRTQTFVDSIMFIGEAITKVIETVIRVIISAASKFAESIIWPLYNSMYMLADAFEAFGNKQFADNLRTVTTQLKDAIHEGTQAANDINIGNLWKAENWTTFNTNNVIDGAKKEGEQLGEGLVDGSVEGVNKKGDDLKNAYVKVCDDTIDAAKDNVESHSPSKVTERLWRDVMLGSIIGLKKGSKEFKKEADKINKQQKKLMVNGAIDTSKAWNQILAKSGVTITDKEMGVKSLRNTKVKIFDFGAANTNDPNQARVQNLTKEVDLNQQLLELVFEQKDALDGKNITEARGLVEAWAAEKGIAATWEDVSNVVYAAMSTVGGATVVTAEAIDKLSENTALSLMDVVEQEKVATQMVIDDNMQRYFNVWKLAEENKDKLVGKKKEEVQEILKEEAMAHGLSEQEAEDSARMVTAAMFAGKKANEQITKDELASKISAYKRDYLNYQKNEEKKTELLQKQTNLRAEIEATGYYDVMEKLRSGKMTVSEYQAWASSADAKNVSKLLTEYNNTKRLYAKELDKELEDVKGMYKKAGMSDENIGKYINEQLKKANKAIDKATESASKKSAVETIKSAYGKLRDALGLGASGTDKSYWNDKGVTGNGGGGGGKGKDPVTAAKDLKKDLEANKADLTPTFDLDKLASDANKANGIVMSSLMAAQNASIGDYINQDSELNPFMKDRWQNVYNFTQNNYSPKALSRIDIYRQTQRQISMSRGF